MHLNICIKCYPLVQVTVECHFWIPSMNKNVEIIALIINRKKKSFQLFTLITWETHVLGSCRSPQSFIFCPRCEHQLDAPVFSWDGPLQGWKKGDNGVELEWERETGLSKSKQASTARWVCAFSPYTRARTRINPWGDRPVVLSGRGE